MGIGDRQWVKDNKVKDKSEVRKFSSEGLGA